MSQNLKQLKIKTSILKRLRKEYESYRKETFTLQANINKLQQDLLQVQKDEEMEISIRKNKEFLAESETVLENVKQKLIEAFEALTLFLCKNGAEEGIVETNQKQIAENLVLEVETFLQNIE